MCPNRVAVIQSIHDEPLRYCPDCGLEVRRVVSRASFSMRGGTDADKAATRGFSTFRKSEKGVWEKVAGPNNPDFELEDP